jgi:hypothetical protein
MMLDLFTDLENYFKYSQIFLLPRNLTEMIDGVTEFKVTASSYAGDEVLATDSQVFRVVPEAFTEVAVLDET